MIEALIICDSISEQGKRLTTFKLRYPRFVHSEFMTHRVISRNASSSRAIPTSKLIEEVRSDALRAAPVFWGKNQSGMQAAEELSDKPEGAFYSRMLCTEMKHAKELWGTAAYHASRYAELLMEHGVHKQIANRLLEPFSHINVVATATEWDNFFGLRLHKDAQPEMRALAVAMWEAMRASTPKLLKPGEWHTPFAPNDSRIAGELFDTIERGMRSEQDYEFYQQTGLTWPQQLRVRISVARCARVSYESFETGKRSTVEEDLKLYDRLVGAQPLHASPAEHQATPDTNACATEWQDIDWAHSEEHGNFVGWRQYRKMLKGEAVAPLPDEFLPF